MGPNEQTQQSQRRSVNWSVIIGVIAIIVTVILAAFLGYGRFKEEYGKKIGKFETDIGWIKRTIEPIPDLKTTVALLQKETAGLKKNFNDFRKEITGRINKISAKLGVEDYDLQETKIRDLQTQLEEFTRRNEELSKRLEAMNKRIEELSEENTQLKEEIDRLRSALKEAGAM